MVATDFAPPAKTTAANTLIGISPAIANINAPTVTELTSATTYMIHCATENFETTTEVKRVERKMICDPVATEKVGSRKYSMEDIVLMTGSPQDQQALIDSLTLDSIKYFWVRPGLPSTTAVASGHKVMVIKGAIDAVDPVKIDNSDGNEFGVVVKVSVQARTQLYGTVAT